MKSFSQNEGANAEEQLLLENLCSEDPGERYQAVRKIRNLLIGLKSRKSSFVSMGLIEKLLDLMVEEDATVEFGVEAAVILGSIARGDHEDLRHVLDSHAVPILCKGLCHHDERLVNACLRSLRICFMTNQVPMDLIFEDENIVTNLVHLLSVTSQTAEYAANILQRSCKTASDQSMLMEAGTISALTPWLKCKQTSILVPVLGCLSSLINNNEVVANKMLECDFSGISVKEELVKLISRDRPEEVQLEAARCLTKIFRAINYFNNGNLVQRKILTVFVRMCQPEKAMKLRYSAALGLAYLIEDDCELQGVAAISNHLIKNISQYFIISNNDTDYQMVENLREGSFKVFAALSANDEKIRKQIVDNTPNIVSYLHEAINQETNISLQSAALQCLLSLSRSVHQLRTTFQDVKLWEPVISALKSSSSDDIISVASSVLCNLLLGFSPCKESLVEYGALDVLVKLMKQNEVPLRVNGVWGLMNLAYDANDSLKNKIVETVGVQNILSYLHDSHVDVAVKALGVLRNLLTENEQDIDTMMKMHGSHIITSVKPLLIDDNLNEKLKEQVLCLLSNIANGRFSKAMLLADEELFLKVINCLTSSSEQLQVASIFCVTNLIKGEDDASIERIAKLRQLGVDKQLRASQNTVNVNLCDRIKAALERFT